MPGGKGKGETRKDYLATTVSCESRERHISVQTVHAVKGETHDVTIFVCPEPHRKDDCPSMVWWSDAPSDQEERRIAFVAVTRTRGDLIVCVSEECFGRLQKLRADFVQSFECMAVDEFIANRCTQLAIRHSGENRSPERTGAAGFRHPPE